MLDIFPQHSFNDYTMAQRKSRSGGLAKAIAAAKTMTALANRIGVSVQAVAQWNEVPPERCLDVERETGVPRYELRPDVYGRPPESGKNSRRVSAAKAA
jgi:DNA-binding transcriptional regulator YdaS (Cro superfamily)